jgi:hypothetical protein
MANFKRKRTKRSVRCTMCTRDRWKGNNAGRFKGDRPRERMKQKKEMNDRD